MLDTTLTTLVWCSIFNDSPLHFSFHLFISQVSFSLGNSAYHISLSLSMFTQFGLEPFPSSTECICPQTSKASELEFHTISVSRFVIHLANTYLLLANLFPKERLGQWAILPVLSPPKLTQNKDAIVSPSEATFSNILFQITKIHLIKSLLFKIRLLQTT